MVATHLWVSASPYFESVLLIAADPDRGGGSVQLSLFDASGEPVNEVEVQYPADAPYLLALEPLMGDCKLESGIRHGHLVVEHDESVVVLHRLQAKESAVLQGPPALVTEAAATFFPIIMAPDICSFLCAINLDQQDQRLRCRLFIGNRSPDVVVSVPARGSSLVMLEQSFLEFVPRAGESRVHAYVRLSTKSGRLGVSLLEREGAESEQKVFSTVS